MCLFITTTNYLNNAKDVFEKIKNNDTLCIVYDADDEGLSIETVENLLQKNVERKFMHLDRNDERAAAFNLGLMIGKERDKNKEVVLLSEDDLFVLASTLMEKHSEELQIKCETKSILSNLEEPVKVPAKRGRKPKVKPQEMEVVGA